MKRIVYELISEKKTIKYKKNISDELYMFMTNPFSDFKELDDIDDKLANKFENFKVKHWDIMYDIANQFLKKDVGIDYDEIDHFDIEDWDENEILVVVNLFD